VIRYNLLIGVFSNLYINHQVKFNIQDAFLKSDIFNNKFIRAFMYISI